MPPKATSASFKAIQAAIRAEQPISAIYRGERGRLRQLFPHVLGFTSDLEEIVLCYQFGGYSPVRLDSKHPSPKNWRCFRVKELTEVAALDMPKGPWTPRGYSAAKQKSVTKVKAKV